MSHYTKLKDPNFKEKMTQVLHIYEEVEIFKIFNQKEPMVAYLSYDEKPGMKAIENTSSDLSPVPGKIQIESETEKTNVTGPCHY